MNNSSNDDHNDNKRDYIKESKIFLMKDKIQLLVGILSFYLLAITSFFLFNESKDIFSLILWNILFTFFLLFGLIFGVPGILNVYLSLKNDDFFKEVKSDNIVQDVNFKRSDSIYHISLLIIYELVKVYYYLSFFFTIFLFYNQKDTRFFLVSMLKFVFGPNIENLPNEALASMYCFIGSFFFFIYITPKIYKSLIYHSNGIVSINYKNKNKELIGIKIPEISSSDLIFTIILIIISNFVLIKSVINNKLLFDVIFKGLLVYSTIIVSTIFSFYLWYRNYGRNKKESILHLITFN